MSNRFLIVILVIIAVIGGIIFQSKKKDKTETNTDTTVTSQSTNHVVGAGTDNVTLTEYGDFQCPSCGNYYPVLKQVKAKYGDRIKFQFKNFPLTEIHKNALIASRAAEAANIQGKFWEMHNKLFETQRSWSEMNDPTSVFTAYAQELGLDVAKFTTDLKSSAVNDIIQADRAEAKELDLSGTPSFTINGQKIENPNPTVDDFSKVIDEAISKNKPAQ